MKTNSDEKGLGRVPPLVQYAETSPLFTLADLRRRYGHKADDAWIYAVLSNLKHERRVRAVCPGVYAGALSQVPLNRYALPSNLRQDAVIAFHSALEFHGLANQVFETVYYLSVRPRRDVKYEQVTYHRVTPPIRLVRAGQVDFQVETHPGGVRVTGRERALVDCLHSLEYSGGVDELDHCVAMFPSFDFETAFKYLRLLRRPWLFARVGYLLDRHAEKLFFTGKWRDVFLRHVPRGVVYLERKRPGCRWVSTWNQMVPPSLADFPKQEERR
jgi:predicted transcriptional regulator of viral defense system